MATLRAQRPRLVILRSPTRQSRYGDGASVATKNLPFGASYKGSSLRSE
jgi:hypothetical protein